MEEERKEGKRTIVRLWGGTEESVCSMYEMVTVQGEGEREKGNRRMATVEKFARVPRDRLNYGDGRWDGAVNTVQY